MTTSIVTVKYKEAEGRQFNKVSAQLSIWCTLCRRTRTKEIDQTVPPFFLAADDAHTPNYVRSVRRFWSNNSRPPDEKK